jgi:peptidoglycan/LPS O-acetylase OafA/YrhL
VVVASIAAAVWVAEVVITSSRPLSVHFTPLFSSDWITIFAFKVEVMKVLLLVPIFLSGSLLYLYREKVPDSGFIALGATVLFLAGMVIPLGQGSNDYYQTSLDLTAIFLVYPLIWLGIHLPFARVCAVNDYSYGIYIYAFPIQQLLTMWGVNRWGYGVYTLLTLAAVIPIAVASWWLVEKHALKLKKLKVAVPFRSKSPEKPDGVGPA